MQLKIRLAVHRDLKEMQQLFVETIQHTCRKDYNQEQIEVWVASVTNDERWEHLLKDQYCIIAEADNKIAGYGSLRNGNFVDFMYVHKDYLRRGIASKIYQELEKESKRRGYSKMASDVSITARPFFEKKGFKVIRENKKEINGVEISNFHMSQ